MIADSELPVKLPFANGEPLLFATPFRWEKSTARMPACANFSLLIGAVGFAQVQDLEDEAAYRPG